MDMQEFIARIHEINLRIANFNTYIHNGINYCFIIVTERGNTGRFFKDECPYHDLNVMLQLLLDDIKTAIEKER